jgi:hypothetical protein
MTDKEINNEIARIAGEVTALYSKITAERSHESDPARRDRLDCCLDMLPYDMEDAEIDC